MERTCPTLRYILANTVRKYRTLRILRFIRPQQKNRWLQEFQFADIADLREFAFQYALPFQNPRRRIQLRDILRVIHIRQQQIRHPDDRAVWPHILPQQAMDIPQDI